MKKLFTMLLCLIVGIGSMNAKVIASGSFSGGTWKIENSVLEIHATTIPDYKAGTKDGVNFTYAPWNYYRSIVNTVKLYNVSYIGKNAFAGFSKLSQVSIYEKTNADIEIGSCAFRQCFDLRYIDLTYVKKIGIEAFSQCVSLETVVLPNVQTICRYAFEDCTGLYHASYDGAPSLLFTGSTIPTIEEQQDLSGRHAYHVLHPETHTQVGKAVGASDRLIIVASNSSLKSNLETYFSNSPIKGDVRLGGILPHSGQISDLLCYWYVNQREQENVLFISGYGDLDFASETTQPWYSVRNSIDRVYLQVRNGQTRIIGKNAFKGLTNLTSVGGL